MTLISMVRKEKTHWIHKKFKIFPLGIKHYNYCQKKIQSIKKLYVYTTNILFP